MNLRDTFEQYLPEDPDDTAHIAFVLTAGFALFLLTVGYIFTCGGGSCQ